MKNIGLIVLGLMLVFVGCKKKTEEAPAPSSSSEVVGDATETADASEATEPEGTEFKEQAAFEVKGDTVQVNNTYCAVSHTQIKAEDAGKWVSTVKYEGANEKFKGKTFIFNQCCPSCVEQFSATWKENADKILQEYGII